MSSSLDELEELIQFSTRTSGSRADFTHGLRPIAYKSLTLKQIKSAIRHLKTFSEPLVSLKIALLGSYTLELLREYWIFHGLIHGFDVELYFAPYGQVFQELREDSKLIEFQPDITYLMLQWTDIAQILAEPLHALKVEERERINHKFTSNLEELISATHQFDIGKVVLNFLPFPNTSSLGLYDVMSISSNSIFRINLKESISKMIRENFPSTYFDDGDFLLTNLGNDTLFDFRLWYTSRFPYSTYGANLLVHNLIRFPVIQMTPKVKCIVLDGDNTLWGGIVGEKGYQGVDLGPDYPGSCFVAFQRRLLDFQHRGILLALCSKNNPDDVQEALNHNPHMILKDDHFASVRVNWDTKPDNLKSISVELSLGLDSFLFVDDSPQECSMMRKILPEVRTVQVPSKPIDIPTSLDHLQELEILSFTDEDRERSKMYVQNRQRKEIVVSSNDISDYLKSLQMNMEISINGLDHIPRISQLTQKTNQFNLTTKRYSEREIQSFLIDPDWLIAYFSLEDIYGNSGIVGLALVTNMEKEIVDIDTFLLSCRIIGRKAEDVFLYMLLKFLRDQGKSSVISSYISTHKNSLVRDFWKQQGFTKINEEMYEFHLDNLSDKHPSDEFFQVHLFQENY